MRAEYRPRGPDPLRTLFRQRFSAFQASYEQRYAAFFGKFRLPSSRVLPSRFASAETGARASHAFVVPIAATTCSVPSRARASSSVLHAPRSAPSSSGSTSARTSFCACPTDSSSGPKVLRVFLRHDRQLFADIGRLVFDILTRYFTQAMGRSIHAAREVLTERADSSMSQRSIWRR